MNDQEIITEARGTGEELMVLSEAVPRFLEIRTQIDLNAATLFLHQVARVKARIGEIFDPQAKKAHDLWKSLLAERNKMLDQVVDIDGKVRTKVAEYVREQDRIRFEAERSAALTAAKIDKVTEKAIDKAHELIQNGKLEEADLAVEKAKAKIGELKGTIEIPDKTDTNGVQVKTVWTFEIMNEDRVPSKFKKPDLVAIGAFVTRFKDQAWKHLPGVRVFTKDVVAVRTGK